VHQGDVVNVAVHGTADDAPMTASFLGREIEFDFESSDSMWHALIGIDLAAEPGTYPLQIRRGAARAIDSHSIEILAQTFRVRRLKVPGTFVDPPDTALKQIADDSKALADAYAKRSERQWAGAFAVPVDGTLSSNFGSRSYYNGQPRAPHAGVDFVAATGVPIRAPNRGTVVLAKPMYFTGNTIVIDHGRGLFSVFAHLSAIHVAVGAKVDGETIVGLVGATGRVTGPHLHWSIRLDGARVNPLSLIAATK
jgi:murein DD-endopeptidase MepM/ murein hydrolase activator NlpD